jgi:LysR family nitrogen assimilation transcriptional regulator
MVAASIEIKQLRYFAAIARSGTFTAASKHLNVSQPALGYQIKQLEETLGVELMIRHARGITLTAAGIVLLRQTEDLMQVYQKTVDALDVFRGKLTGSVNLGVTPTSGRFLVSELLAACSAHPGLQMSLTQRLTAELWEQLAAGYVTAALYWDPPPLDSLTTEPIYRDSLFLIGPPSLVDADLGDIPFSALAGFPLVLDTRQRPVRLLLDAVSARAGIKLTIAYEIDPTDVKREVVLRSRCCMISQHSLFQDEIRRGLLAARLIVRPHLDRTLHAVFTTAVPASIRTFMVSCFRAAADHRFSEGESGWKRP